MFHREGITARDLSGAVGGFDTNGVTGEKGWYVQPSRITLAHAPRVLLLGIASSAN